MAKSLRSKQKKANRALKRERYAVKEKARLEKVVELAKESAANQETKEVYTVIGAPPKAENTEKMAVDGEENVIKLPPAEDENENVPMGVGQQKPAGNYPVWMNKRAIKKAKLAAKKKKVQKNKSMRAKSKPWRK